MNLVWIWTGKTLQHLGSEPDLDSVNGKEMWHFCCQKAAWFNFFALFGLGCYIWKIFWTVVELGLAL